MLIGIVEDELIIAETLRESLMDLGYEVTESAISYSEALDMIDNEKPDLVLLDIMLSGHRDGIELAEEIRNKYKLPFIFLTSNSDLATVERAKSVHPNGYLVKPFNREDLYTAIEIAISNYSTLAVKNDKPAAQINNAIFIKQDHLFHKVKFDEIMYLKSDHVYIEVYTEKQKFLVRSSLGDYLDNLPSELFFRIHRGYAINLNFIEAINNTYTVVAGQELPIGKTYRDELMSIIRQG